MRRDAVNEALLVRSCDAIGERRDARDRLVLIGLVEDLVARAVDDVQLAVRAGEALDDRLRRPARVQRPRDVLVAPRCSP
jgi:hypothetical protein